MPNVQAIQILSGANQVGSSPFGDYDQPTKSLQLKVIDWGATNPDKLLNTTLTLKGTFMADEGAFVNDMKLIGLNQGGVDGTFKG